MHFNYFEILKFRKIFDRKITKKGFDFILRPTNV